MTRARQCALCFQVIEYLPDYQRIFNTRNHLDRTSTLTTGLDLNRKYPLQALGPGHGHTAFEGCFLLTLLVRAGFSSPAPLCWSDSYFAGKL
jgi:hypothetical protein